MSSRDPDPHLDSDIAKHKNRYALINVAMFKSNEEYSQYMQNLSKEKQELCRRLYARQRRNSQ